MCNALDTDGEVLHFIAPNVTLEVNDLTLYSYKYQQFKVCSYIPDLGLVWVSMKYTSLRNQLLHNYI